MHEDLNFHPLKVMAFQGLEYIQIFFFKEFY